MTIPDPLDCPFHASALQAYLEVAHATQGWPESEAVKRRAYQLYEQGLAEKTKGKPPLVTPSESA